MEMPKATIATTNPTVPEQDRLSLHNLLLQQQVSREQLNVLTLQFLQTSGPRALQDRIEKLASEIESMVGRIFADAGLDQNLYQFNVDQGRFIERN